MYSLIIYYPNVTHLRENTPSVVGSTVSIVSGLAIELDKRPLVQMINQIFDGKHSELFGKTDFIMGEPEFVILTTQNVMQFKEIVESFSDLPETEQNIICN